MTDLGFNAVTRKKYKDACISQQIVIFLRYVLSLQKICFGAMLHDSNFIYRGIAS